MATSDYKAVFIKKDTHTILLREKLKRSIEKGKTVTFDTLLKELVTKKI